MVADVAQKMLAMLIPVAEALGDELLPNVAFVGGSTTVFLISDPITRQAVRFTEDVDLILKVDGRVQWVSLQKQLRERGFKESMEEDHICRMLLGNIKVDFLPDDATILNFTNRWYHAALAAAQPYSLTKQITINLLTPEYFIATKLEAYHGRGNNDPMSSHDLEDIINLVDGRAELLTELQQAESTVRSYIAEQFATLLQHANFDYAIQGNLHDVSRIDLFFDQWEQIAALK